MKCFMSYFIFCSVLVFTVCSAQRIKIPHNLHHVFPAKNEPFLTRHHQCYLICTNHLEDINNGGIRGNLSIGDNVSRIIPNLHDLPGNPASLVGIVFNRTGGFNGLVNRISNLRDVIHAFPHSSDVIITRLGELRSNPFLRGLLQFGNQLYSNASAELQQVANRRRTLREVFQRLPNLSGIFSTPIGIIFNPFDIRLFREVSGHLNPSNVISQFRILFDRLPSLAGIFIRPAAFLSSNLINLGNPSLRNLHATFFGSGRGFSILRHFVDRILSQLNLSHSTNSGYLIRFLPIFTNIIQDLFRINPAEGGRAFINWLSSLRNTFNNSRLYNEIIHAPYEFREIPRAISSQERYILRLITNLFASFSQRSGQPIDIRDLLNRFSTGLNDLYKTLNSGSSPLRFLNAGDFRQFLGILLRYFENAVGDGNSNIDEIINRFSNAVSNLYKILGSGGFSSSAGLDLFLNMLRYFERAIGNVISGNLDINEIINRFSSELSNLERILSSNNSSAASANFHPFLSIAEDLERPIGNRNSRNFNINEFIRQFSNELLNLYNVSRSGNTSANFSNSASLEPFLPIIQYLQKAIGSTSTRNLNINEIIRTISSDLNNANASAEFLNSPFLNILQIFIRLLENANAQNENDTPYYANNSTNNSSRTVESRFKGHHHVLRTSIATTANSGTTEGTNHGGGTGGNGNGGAGSGSIGIGGAGINEKNAKHTSQKKIKPREKHSKPHMHKDGNRKVGAGSVGTKSGSIGTRGGDINRKSAKQQSWHKINQLEKEGAASNKQSIHKEEHRAVGTEYNESGVQSGSNEKQAKHLLRHSIKPHAEEHSITAKPTAHNDQDHAVVGIGGNGYGGSGSGSIGIGGAGINEKSVKQPTHQKIGLHGKHSSTSRPLIHNDGSHDVGIGGNGNGGPGSGSIGIGGEGINERQKNN